MKKHIIFNKKEFGGFCFKFFDNSKFCNIKGFEDKDIYIYNNPESNILHSQGACFAALMKVNIFGGDNAFLIVTDKEYNQLPNFANEFYFHHEVGHFVCNHLNTMSEDELRLTLHKRALGFLPTMEIEADAYAASVIGHKNCMQSLFYIIMRTNLPIRSKIESLRRIFHLTKNITPLG